MAARRRRWPWVLLFLCLLLAVVIATFPAQLVWRWVLAGQLREVKLEGVSGTVWAGNASELRVRGLSVGALDWSLDPWSLLRTEPALRVHLGGSQIEAQAQLQRLADGTLALHALQAQLDARWLGPVLDLPALVTEGRVQIQTEQLRIAADGVPISGKLTLDWTDAAVAGLAQAPVGTVRVEAQGAARRWLGTVSSTPDSPLAIDGGFNLIERSYTADIRIAARDPNHPAAQVLRYIGQAQADGSQRLLISGELLPLGL